MSATSKRDRALQAGVEPVTDKAMHTGEAPMPEYLNVDMAVAPEPAPAPAPEPVEEPEDSDDE